MYIDTATGIQTKPRVVPIPAQRAQALAPAPVQDIQTVLYERYKDLLSSIVNLRSPSMMVDTVQHNNLYNRGLSGQHDKFIMNGRRIADLSVGYLQMPWTGADFDRKNEVTPDQFARKAAGADMHVAQKLWAIADFLSNLQANFGNTPRIYYYKADDVTVVTLWDEVNGIKFGCMPSENI